LAQSGLSETSTRLSAFGAKRTCRHLGWRIARAQLTLSRHTPNPNPAAQQSCATLSVGSKGAQLKCREFITFVGSRYTQAARGLVMIDLARPSWTVWLSPVKHTYDQF
jgi:hypothetical protein